MPKATTLFCGVDVHQESFGCPVKARRLQWQVT